MANDVNIQTIQDGTRNLIIKVTGVLDTSNVSKTTLVDVSALAPEATLLNLKRALWSIQDPLSVNLYWNADADVLLYTLHGFEHHCFDDFPIPNNAGTGVNGDVEYETTGYSSGTVTFTFILWFTKNAPNPSA